MPNGSGICDVAAIEARQPNLAQKFNSSTTVEHLTSSRHIANTLLAVRCCQLSIALRDLIASSVSGTKKSSPFTIVACIVSTKGRKVSLYFENAKL